MKFSNKYYQQIITFFILFVSLLLFLIFFLPVKSFSQDYFSQSAFNNPILTTLADYIESIYPASFIFTSGTGLYGINEQLYFSFYGNNHQWNKYYLDGFYINSLYFTGTPLYDFRISLTDLSFDPFKSIIYGQMTLPYGFYFNTYGSIGNMGGPIPYTEDIVFFFARHLSSLARDPVALEDRRYLRYLYGFLLTYYEENMGNLSFIKGIFTFDIGEKTFLSYYRDSSHNALYNVTPEFFYKLQTLWEFGISQNINLFFTFFHQYRDNYGSEFYYSSSETAELYDTSFSIGINFFALSNYSMEDDSVKFQLNYENTSLAHNFQTSSSYSNEITSPDGESLYSYYPDGIMHNLEIALDSLYNVSDNLYFYSNFISNFSYFESAKDTYTVNLLYYDDYIGKIIFKSSDCSWLISNGDFGLTYSVEKGLFSYKLEGLLLFSSLILFEEIEKNLIFFSFDFSSKLNFSPSKYISMDLDFGKNSVRIDSSVAKILSSTFLYGSYYNEANELLFNTSGQCDDIVDSLKQPYYFYLRFNFQYKSSGGFYFQIDSQLRTFQNLFWIRAKNANSYTSTINSSGEDVYYISDPDIGYVLTNYEEALEYYISNNLVSSDIYSNIPEFFRNPFYAGVVFTVGKSSKDTIFQMSFWAYMVVGITAIGNGIVEDEIGTISENLADPNLFLTGFGRMISDRSYVFKLYFAQRLFSDLWIGLTIKYRDGQPFSALLTQEIPGEYVIIYNHNVPGDNPFTGEFGRREDCLWEFNFSLSGSFELFNMEWNVSLVLYNFLDMAFEICEDVFWVGYRKPLELQIPRGIGLNLSFVF